jgi:hypothetical protein
MEELRDLIRKHRNAFTVAAVLAVILIACCLIALLSGKGAEVALDVGDVEQYLATLGFGLAFAMGLGLLFWALARSQRCPACGHYTFFSSGTWKKLGEEEIPGTEHFVYGPAGPGTQPAVKYRVWYQCRKCGHVKTKEESRYR